MAKSAFLRATNILAENLLLQQRAGSAKLDQILPEAKALAQQSQQCQAPQHRSQLTNTQLKRLRVPRATKAVSTNKARDPAQQSVLRSEGNMAKWG